MRAKSTKPTKPTKPVKRRRASKDSKCANPSEPLSDFTTDGFLGERVARTIQPFLEEHAKWVALFRGLNRLGCKVLNELRPKGTPQELLATAVFYRVLTAGQSAFLLIERGNDVDSKAMLRNMMEALFSLSAIVNEPGFAKTFIRADDHARLKKLKKFLEVDAKHGGNPFMSTEQIEETKREIARLEAEKKSATWVKSEEVQIAKIAKIARLETLYQQIYPYLCSFTHGSPSGLADYITVTPQEIKFLRGQSDKDAEGNLRLAANLLLTALKNVEKLFALDLGSELNPFATMTLDAIRSSKTQRLGSVGGGVF